MQNSTITRQARDERPAQAPELVVLGSPDPRFPAGRIIRLKTRRVIGRQPGPFGVELDDLAASRKHARIEWHTRHRLAELTDLDSKNGTFVNGLLTVRRYLEAGDVVRIGDTVMVVRELDDPVSHPETAVLGGLVGNSPVMSGLKQELARVARADIPVLLIGETGTGKELAARALHDLSARSGGYQVVNCAAVPENLFESTFFGHRKGAFTGATEDADGLLRGGHEGTIFLDEIGELPPSCQPKLLRFLEDGMIHPVGGGTTRHVDTRVVAATNAPVFQMEEDGRFRSDLLGRLAGLTVLLPPLRERVEDISLLFSHFLSDSGVADVSLEPDALEALLIRPWKRNVRELRSLATYWAQVTWPERQLKNLPCTIELSALPTELRDPILNRQRAAIPPRLPDASRPTKQELEEAIKQHDGNLQRVAELFNRDRKQIYRWMDRYGLER